MRARVRSFSVVGGTTVTSTGEVIPRKLSTRPSANPNTPPVPAPIADVASLAACCAALKQCMESLLGQRGPATNRAVTFDDLVNYGLLSPSAVGADKGRAAFGGGAADAPVTSVAGKKGDVVLDHNDIPDWDENVGLL
jgi:hypothetical protein